MKRLSATRIFLILALILCSSFKNETEARQGSCDFIFGLPDAIRCAKVGDDISAYNEQWPKGTNSTMFFKLIDGNKKLKVLNFCGVHIDSLPASIGNNPNLEQLFLTDTGIKKIPKEIGKLKKLKQLTLGSSTTECMGNPVSFIPKQLGDCESLEELELAFSTVSDLPRELKKCKKLKRIDLSFNKKITPAKLKALKAEFPGVEIITTQQ